MAKKLRVAALAFVAAVSLSLGGLFMARSRVIAAETWEEVAIESSYICGDALTVPSRKLTIGGKEYAAEVKLVLPDGTATSRKEVTLEKTGKYTVQYYVCVDGVPYADEVSFVVNEKAYTYANEETKVAYGKGTYEKSPETTGLYVQLKELDSLSFNKIIDVPDVNEDIPLVKYFIAPSEIESADFTRITFTFTDVSDPTCNLRIVAQSSNPDTNDGKGGCYLLAGGNGQLLKGDQSGKIHVNNQYGAYYYKGGSFFGYGITYPKEFPNGVLAPEGDPSVLAIELEFNPVTCEVKVNNSLIIDTDSKNYYGGASDVKWTGFKSGKVKLSIKCEGYNKSAAGFVLTDVKDVDLSSDDCADDVPPEITIVGGYDEGQMPFAYVGKGEYYTIPSATAFDLISGECAVKTAVYRDYGLESQSRVNVVGGKFETEYAGVYAIVYTAYDDSGNKSDEKILYVTAKTDVPEIEITASGLETSYEAGAKVIVPKPQVTGGSGDKTVTARVYCGDEEYYLGADEREWAFFPESSGEWKIEYTAVDYVGHKAQKTYDASVVNATVPSFRDEVALPRAFVAGLGNRLPELIAYDYTSGKLVTAAATVAVTDKNGTKTYKSGEVFVPEVANNGDKISVTYSYGKGTNAIEQGPFEIPAILAYENDELAVGNYFYDTGDGAFEKIVTDHGLKIVAREGEHSWTFANALVANGFSLTFGGVENACDYGKMTVTLTDSVNPAEKLTVEMLCSDTGKTSFACGSLSDDTSAKSLSGENGDIIKSFTVGLTKNRLFVNGYAYDPDKYADGSKFNGFSSGMVNLTFTATEMTENSAYYVTEVNSYVITRARLDRSAPNVSLSGDYGGYYSKGATYVFRAAVSADVLAPVVDFGMSVKDPDGNYAVSVDGITLKDVDPTRTYTLKLDKYGVYGVSYTSVENNAPRQNPNTGVSYEIHVTDDEAPVYTVSKNMSRKIKLGETVELPTFTVTDNLTSAENIVSYMVIVNPNGRSVYVTGGSFKFDFAGKYKISCYFADEAGNTAVYSFTVTVE